MGIAIEPVEPPAFADAASGVLQEAWGPPSIRYTPEYLRWHFGFPGAAAALGVAAFDGPEPVGFAGVVPRRLRLGPTRFDAWVLSFVAVRPAWRGHGIASAVYRALLAAAARTRLPILAYAQPDTAGRHVLLGAFEAAGFRRQPLGVYRTYGCRPGPGTPPRAEADAGGVRAVVDRCDRPGVLWSDPDPAQWEHYLRDPRGRVAALVRGPDGGPSGAAMVVRCELVAPRGVEHVAMIDSVFLPEPSAAVLGALLRFADGCWAGRVSSPVVTATNLWGLDPDLLRSVGLRATPSCFEGYLFTKGDDGWPAAEGTNLEVI